MRVPSSMPAGMLTDSVAFLGDAALAAAIGAGVLDHLAAALAVRAGALDGEEALRGAHPAGAVAGRQVVGLVPGLAPEPRRSRR